MSRDWTWHNEPNDWDAGEDGALTLRTAPKTDFWRHTHYDFVRDSGHFRGVEVAGDFRLTAVVRGAYADLYDQAGLMVRLDDATWMKCGIELVDGVQWASVVVTREHSDWSRVPLTTPPDQLRLDVARTGATLDVRFGPPGAEQPLRLAHLTDLPVRVGPMAASPEGQGFHVSFDEVALFGRTP